MPAESQLGVDVFAEIVVAEDALVDAHVDVPDLFVDDLLADHDVLDLLVGDLLDLDELALAHLLDVSVDHFLADDLAAQDVSLILADLSLLQDDAVELLVVDLEDDLLLLIDALLVDELALDESVLVLLVLDILEELAGHDGNLVVPLDVHCRCQLPCSRWDRLVEVVVETTLLHRMLPHDGSIRDVHLDTSRDPDTDDANIPDAIHDVDLDDTNLLDATLLLVVVLPIHLLIDDVPIIVHLVASLDTDVPLLLRP